MVEKRYKRDRERPTGRPGRADGTLGMGKDVRKMPYQKYAYSRISWENKSDSLATPIGKTNLNKMDSAIYNIAENLDVVQNDLSSGKFDKADAGKVIVGMPAWNPNTGVLSFKFYDGTTFQVDFNVEKIPVSFSMNSAGVITMTTSDGTQWTANIGDVVPDYTFDDSETIAFAKGYDWDTSQYSQIDAYGYGPPDNWAASENKDRVYLDRSSGIAYACAYDGKKYFLATAQLQRAGKNVRICGEVRKGSITGEHLRPDYLADVSAQAGNAAASANAASDSADDADFDAKLSQSYAVGGSGVRQGEDSDNAKKYKELCQDIYDNFQQSGNVTGVKGAAEDTFRNGNVDITPENIGAAAKGDLDELKKSVSDGKSAVASAITEMGVSTASDAAFGAIAENIEKIKPTITVGGGVSGTWSGATFTYGGGCGGSASINGKNTATATATIASKSTTAGGNAKASDVLSGKTFSSNNAGREIAGSMPNHTNVRKELTGTNNSAENGGYSISGSTMRVCPATGYHDYINTSWENALQIEVGNASASDVLAGKRFTSSAGRNVQGTILSARATGAKQFGASFPVASSGYPYFCLWYLDHVSYSQFGLHHTINTNNLGSVIGGENDQAIIRVTGGGGTINVLRSSWSFNASNFNRMVVSLYGKSSYVGGSLEFRGCVGVCAKGAASSTGAEGRDYALSYGAYQFTSTSSAWHSNIVVDLSQISQEVQFHMSTVHAGEVYVNSIGFVPN